MTTRRPARSRRPAAPARTYTAVEAPMNSCFTWYHVVRDDGRRAMDRSKGDVRRLSVRADDLKTLDCSKLEFMTDAEQDAANKALGF